MSSSFGRVALGLGLLGILAAAAATPDTGDAPVRLRAWAEPDTVTVGQRFRYVVEVAVAPEVEVVLGQPTERLGPFDIVDFGDETPREAAGRRIVTRWYRLVGWSPGHQLIRSPPVHYRRPGEALAEAEGDDVGVTVASLLEAAGPHAELRDVKGPEPFPPDPRPWLVAGLLLALASGVALTVALLRRRRRYQGLQAPARPPHEIAAAALEALRRQRLPEAGAFDAYYVALSAIVRSYLEQRFGLRAPEMTTEEFLQATARSGALDRPHRALLAEFLGESDLVKFARHIPRLADAERAWTAARRFVDDTADRLGEERRAAG